MQDFAPDVIFALEKISFVAVHFCFMCFLEKRTSKELPRNTVLLRNAQVARLPEWPNTQLPMFNLSNLFSHELPRASANKAAETHIADGKPG